ncbi:hypothetical protein EYZ11_010385 [Aspergillus tanneri]|nr:hypothetical protein EYZ11_010385 [Aspergillus tanneri]
MHTPQEDEDVDPEVVTVASQTPSPDQRFASMTRSSAAPTSQRARSRASEVRFVLPSSTPSRAAAPVEDPRDAELRFLREKITQLEMSAKQPHPQYDARCSAAPAWENRNRFQSEISEYTPEPPRRRQGRARRGRGQPAWNHWTGGWTPANQTY